MGLHVFTRLVEAVQNADPYFLFKYDIVSKAGLLALQNCVVAIPFSHTVSLQTPFMSMFV
jgi:hypothetical protein